MSLKALNMNHCDVFDGASLQFLPHSLTQLGLNDWRGPTDARIAHLTTMALTGLDLGGCIRLSNAALTSLQSEQPSIRRLNLSNCSLINDTGLAALVDMPIEKLNLYGCHHLRDQGLHQLAELPLKNLAIIGCLRTTREGRANFAALEQFENTQFEF